MLRNDPPSMNDARNPAKNGKTDVDEEVSSASGLKKNCDRRDEDGYNVGEDIGGR